MKIVRRGYPSAAVSVCIPTLNGDSQRVADCIDAVLRTDPFEPEIVIADCEGELLGYTKPMNAAMAAAQGDWLVSMNDDVIVTPGWINPLMQAVWDGAWCATPSENQDGEALLYAPHCMVWNAEAWREIGGLDEQFVHWASDIDLARRLIDAGHPPVRVKLPQAPAHLCLGEPNPKLSEICLHDLDRYHRKWEVTAEFDKHRMGALLRGDL